MEAYYLGICFVWRSS